MNDPRVVAVTGANGEIGFATCSRLVAAGHRVRAVDLDRRSAFEDYVRADLTDPWEVRLAVQGADAVVHLAAIGDCPHNDEWCAFRHDKIIRNNVLSTYNVFQAVAHEGAGAVIVWASSETVMGPPFTARNSPDYLPVDASHPRRPSTPYGLSKVLCEHIAEYFGQAQGVASIGLRFSALRSDGPPDYETPADGVWNLWGYVLLEDAVDALVRAAARLDIRGAVFEHVVAPEPASPLDPRMLRKRYLPGVPFRDDAESAFWRPGG